METINAFCSKCNCYMLCIRETDCPPPHSAKIICSCGNWWWEKKDKSKRTKRKNTQVKFDIDYCELCLRPKSELPQGVTLHEHHVLPAPEFPDYDNDIRNRHVYCTRCHDLIERIRNLLELKNYLKIVNHNYKLTNLINELS